MKISCKTRVAMRCKGGLHHIARNMKAPKTKHLGIVKAAKPAPPARSSPATARSQSCLARLRKICGEVIPTIRTQEGFAKWLRVSPSYVIKVENGRRMPAELATRIARATGVDRQSLMNANGVPMRPGRNTWVPRLGADARADREARGLTHEQEAELLGVTVEMVREWERAPARPARVLPAHEFTVDDFREWLGRGDGSPEHQAVMLEAARADASIRGAIGNQVAALIVAATERGRVWPVLQELQALIGELADGYGIRDTYLRELRAKQPAEPER
jgi:DNA-binding transcriptional regulator YiaG